MPSHSHNKVQKPFRSYSYTVYSSQLHTGIFIFRKIFWCQHLFRPMMGYAHKWHFYKDKLGSLRRNIAIHSE